MESNTDNHEPGDDPSPAATPVSSEHLDATCWICRAPSATAEEELTGPFCACRGSLAQVHRSCLESFVRAARLSHCRNCSTAYRWQAPPREVQGTRSALPTSRAHRAMFLAVHFVLPFAVHVVITLVALAAKFVLAPAAIAVYVLIIRASADEPGGATGDVSDIVRALIVAAVLCGLRRGLARSRQKFYSYFGLVEPAEEAAAAHDVPPGAYHQLWYWARWFRERVAGFSDNRVRQFVKGVIADVVSGVAATWCLSRVYVHYIGLAVLLAALLCRAWRRPRVISSRRGRQEEVLEAKRNVSLVDVHVWFATYVLDLFFFSLLMPLLAGYALHYATAPYFAAIPAEVVMPAPDAALAHWVIGFATVAFMVHVERFLMVPLFALGADLVILRSVQFDEEHDSFDFVFLHLYEVDPLRAIADATRMYCTELPALALAVHAPLRVSQLVHEYLSEAGAVSLVDLSSVLPNATLRIAVPLQQQLPLANSAWTPVLIEAFLLLTALLCFSTFDVQRRTLAVMYPVGRFFAKMTGLDTYLFDGPREAALAKWLSHPIFVSTDGEDTPIDIEAVMPPVPAEQKVTRRERWLDESELPRFLGIKRVTFVLLFFPTCYAVSVMMYTVASVFTSQFHQTALLAIALPVLLIFLSWNPSRVRAAAFHALAVIVAVPILVLQCVAEPCTWPWDSFVEDLYMDTYGLEQHLEVFQLEGAQPDG